VIRKNRSKAPVVVSVREAAKLETREALLDAGLSIFAKEGLDAPSLDAICARAGLTRGAFYVHFAAREDFIVAVMQKATQGFLDAVLLGTEGSFDLERAIAAFAAMAKPARFLSFGQIPPHQFLAACARSRELRKYYVGFLDEGQARVTRAIRAGQAAGKLRADVDAAATASLLVAVALGIETMTELHFPIDLAGGAVALLTLLRA
jgi:TetR/AcrR family transcriptional regulator, transcriptional repressor for nem operon